MSVSRPRRSNTALLSRLVFAALVVGVAFLAPRYYGDPAPLGAPLPPVSYAYETEGVAPSDTNVIDKRIAAEWLEFLAPQPDGSPPLRYNFDSSGADFEIWHPLGVEAVVLPVDQQLATNTLAVGLVKLNQPLFAIKYSVPPKKEGETLEQYAIRAQSDLELNGAQFFGERGELLVTGYRFITLEYERDSEDYGLLYHFLFIGPYGPNALIIDFSAKPDQVEAARPYVDKIIRSFKPKPDLKRLYSEELDALESPGAAAPVETNAE